MPDQTDNTFANRLKSLPAPGGGSIVQRLLYGLSPVSLVLTDMAGYRGDTATHCCNLSADTVRGLIALAIAIGAYLWPALWPRLARHLDFDDSDEVAELKRTVAALKTQTKRD